MSGESSNTGPWGQEKYKKTGGFASTEGQMYEEKFAALLFARALNTGNRFYLATNVDQAGAFNDIVFKYQVDDSCWVTCFVQLKHRPNLMFKMTKFNADTGYFSLKKYFESYCEIKKNVSHDNSSSLFRGPFENCRFLLYTCAKVDNVETEKLQRRERGQGDAVDRVIEQLLTTKSVGKEVFTFDEVIDIDVFSTFQDVVDGVDFLKIFKIFSDQPIEESLDKFIAHELHERYKVSLDEAFILMTLYIEDIKKWWQRKTGFILTENSQLLNDVYRQYVVNDLSMKLQKRFHSMSTFNHTGDLEKKLAERFTSLNIVYEGKVAARLGCYRVLQALRKNKEQFLFMDLKTLQSQLEEVIPVWRDGQKRCLVIVESECEGETDVDEEICEVLKNNNSKRVLILSQNENEIAKDLKIELGERHEAIVDEFLWSHLEADYSRLDLSMMQSYVGLFEDDKQLCHKFVNLQNSEGRSAMHRACAKQDLEMVDLLIKNGGNVASCDNRQETPLHVAAKLGDLLIVNLVLSTFNGQTPETVSNYVNSKDLNGNTSLHLASKNGFCTIVEQLLKSKGDAMALNKLHETSLHAATFKGTLSVVKVLINCFKKDTEKLVEFIDVCDSNNQCSMNLAASKGFDEIVDQLIEAGGDVKKCNSRKRTSLHVAAFNGKLSVVKSLVNSFTCPITTKNYINSTDIYGNTAMIFASENGFHGIVEYLLEKGANVEATNKFGRSALHVSSSNNNLFVVKTLIKGLKDEKNEISKYISLADKNGDNALICASKNGSNDIVEYLIEQGCDVTKTNEFWQTALHVASSKKHVAIVETLLKSFKDDRNKMSKYIAMGDMNGDDAMHLASKIGCSELVEIFLNSNAVVTATNGHEETSLHIACVSNDLTIVKALIESVSYNTSDVSKFVDMRDMNGNTAIHLASANGSYDIVKHLIKVGVDVEVVNNLNQTPLMLASKNKRSGVIQLLTEDTSV